MKTTLQKIMDAVSSQLDTLATGYDLHILEGVIEHILKVDTGKSDDPRGRSHHTSVNLQTALETYQTRNKLYGDNYKRFGKVMAALYNDSGWRFKTPEEFNRAGIILQIVSKLTRYVADPSKGHLDSIHDAGVYCFMLEELDAEQQGFLVNDPEATPVVKREAVDLRESTCQHVWINGRCQNPDCRMRWEVWAEKINSTRDLEGRN